ncbi:MAG TPA: hypothetical protein VKA46_34095 [Gemmataceae bacterium]|nr:hypothetical protein [Gemmataceae bacterium]
MSRIGLVALQIVLVVAAWAASRSSPTVNPDQEFLQGEWQITSVSTDGEPDPAQVGAFVTFYADTVSFAPRETPGLVRVAPHPPTFDPALS